MRPRIPALAAVLAVALIACSDGTEPVPIAGTSALVSIDGQPMPALAYVGMDTDPGDGEYRIIMDSDSIRLAAGGTYQRWSRIHIVYPALGDTFPNGGQIAGTWTIAGDSLTMLVGGTTQATGRLRAGELDVAEKMWDTTAHRLRYRRVP